MILIIMTGSCDCRFSTEELLKNVPDAENLEKNANVFKSIADPTRLKILYLLKSGELCVCEILEALDKSQSTVSHHLNLLKKEEIITSRKEGKWIYYKLADENVLNNLEEFLKVIK